jgi:hypothetical protein
MHGHSSGLVDISMVSQACMAKCSVLQSLIATAQDDHITKVGACAHVWRVVF